MSDLNFHAPTWSDFQAIVRAYSEDKNPVKFLADTHIFNDKLAETMLIYGPPMRADKARGTKAAYTHYVVNSSAALPDGENQLPGGVFQWAANYAASLGLEAKIKNGETVLIKKGYVERPCGQWVEGAGQPVSQVLRNAGIEVNKFRYGRLDVIPTTLFKFNEQAEGNSHSNAIWLADMSTLAYSSETYVRHQLALWGYDLSLFKWLESTETNTQGFVIGRDNHLIICFRGTYERVDWLTDAKFRKTALPNGRGKVHRGFWGAFASVWPELERFLKVHATGKKLFVTGHSLGAALAQLAGEQLTAANFDVHGVYLYGAPLVGNQHFANSYNKRLFDQTFMYINNDDIVTRIPPPFLGYKRVGNPRNRFQFNHNHALNIFKPDDELEALPEDETGDLFLTPAQQAEVDLLFEDAIFTIDDSQRVVEASYGTEFEAGLISDHSTGNYLFKFACAIVDDLWDVLEKRGG